MKATKYNVANWLKKYYGIDDNTAVDLVEANPGIVEDAQKWDSSAYYAADKIAEIAGLFELAEPLDMQIGEDDD